MGSGVYRGNDNTLPVARSSRWREVKGVGPKYWELNFVKVSGVRSYFAKVNAKGKDCRIIDYRKNS